MKTLRRSIAVIPMSIAFCCISMLFVWSPVSIAQTAEEFEALEKAVAQQQRQIDQLLEMLGSQGSVAQGKDTAPATTIQWIAALEE